MVLRKLCSVVRLPNPKLCKRARPSLLGVPGLLGSTLIGNTARAFTPKATSLSCWDLPTITESGHCAPIGFFGSIVLAVAAGSSFFFEARCDEYKEGTSQEEVKDETDPYENLPDEDEETTCSMCQTFRQGPCRPFWRKLERCFKDHENEEGGATKCMRYFGPHQQCLMEFTNLYSLVSLDMKQELVHDIELSVNADERRTWEPDIDWGMWKIFVQEQGLDFRETVPGSAKDTPLWKRLPANKEPVLVNPTVTLARQQEGMILKVAYAVDQDGMVLGFSFNQEYSDLIGKSKGSATLVEIDGPEQPIETNESNSVADDAKPPSSTFELEFVVFPGETTHVRVCALYAENPTLADHDKDILDALLFTGPMESLQTVAQG